MKDFSTEQKAAIGRLEQAFRECVLAGVHFTALSEELLAHRAEDEGEGGLLTQLAVQVTVRHHGGYKGVATWLSSY